MKILKINDKLMIVDGRDPMQYVDLSTKKLYKYPASKYAVIDESSDWPVFKWWRNPVKWYQWRRISRIATKNTKIVLQTTPAQPNPFWKKSDLE